MIGKQGGVAKVNVMPAKEGKKPAGKIVGGGMVKKGVTVKPVKGNNNKLK